MFVVGTSSVITAMIATPRPRNKKGEADEVQDNNQAAFFTWLENKRDGGTQRWEQNVEML